MPIYTALTQSHLKEKPLLNGFSAAGIAFIHSFDSDAMDTLFLCTSAALAFLPSCNINSFARKLTLGANFCGKPNNNQIKSKIKGTSSK